MRRICYIVLMLCLCLQGKAQHAEWKVDSTHFLMGAPLNASLLVKGIPPHTQLLFPYFEEDTTASIDFISAKEPDTSVAGVQQQVIHFMAFDTGWFTLPKAMILVQRGQRLDTIYPQALRVHIFSLPIDTLKSFRINKPLMDIPFHWREFIGWYIGAFLLLVLALLIIWLLKRPKTAIPTSISAAETLLSPYELARRDLLLLEKSALLSKGEEKAFQSKLTDILRVFLSQQFKIATLEATSDEILERSAIHVKKGELAILRKLLTQADLVKFAKESMAVEDHWECLRMAYQFIEMYKPTETITT